MRDGEVTHRRNRTDVERTGRREGARGAIIIGAAAVCTGLRGGPRSRSRYISMREAVLLGVDGAMIVGVLVGVDGATLLTLS